METISGNTPAYPSGHATQSYLLCSLIAHHYEEKREELMQLAGRIAESRIIMGVHYPSDNEFGIKIAKELMEDEAIKEMYLS
jgi:acid phosphatase (class A)